MYNNHHIEMDPEETRKYIFSMATRLAKFVEQKNDVERLLKRLEPVWADSVFITGWNSVVTVSNKIKRVYVSISNDIQGAARFYDRYAIYNDKHGRIIGRVPIAEYEINLRSKDVNINRRMEITDAEEMEKFIVQMRNYIESTRDTIRSIDVEHNNAQRYWKSSQYDELTQIIKEVDRDVRKELQVLEMLNEYVKKKLWVLKTDVSKGIRG